MKLKLGLYTFYAIWQGNRSGLIYSSRGPHKAVCYCYTGQLIWSWSTSFGERESWPFHEEPVTFISILHYSTTSVHLESFVMHSALPARPQPLVRSLQLVEVW